MTLDLSAVSKLVAEMGLQLAETVRSDDERARAAIAALREHADRLDGLRNRLAEAAFSGVAAHPEEPLDRRVALPSFPTQYLVGATDGSLVEPDRHGAAYYYLMNIGKVILRYGEEPKAELTSVPRLGYRPEDLYLELGEREMPLEGGVLRVRRAVAELQGLVEVVARRANVVPTVGLQDGTLILWMPEGRGQEADLRRALLDPYLTALDSLRKASVPVASYISRPRSSELINTLRMAICPFPKVDCRSQCRHRTLTREAPCDQVAGIADRRLMAEMPLQDGERSALFFAGSRIVEQYREHRIFFFYLNVGTEVARVEVPQWVARDEAQLALVHAVIYDQCRRGQGYPRALTEAHEKAVVGVADRQQCERLVEAALARHGIRVQPSQKQMSKRLRGV